MGGEHPRGASSARSINSRPSRVFERIIPLLPLWTGFFPIIRFVTGRTSYHDTVLRANRTRNHLLYDRHTFTLLVTACNGSFSSGGTGGQRAIILAAVGVYLYLFLYRPDDARRSLTDGLTTFGGLFTLIPAAVLLASALKP